MSEPTKIKGRIAGEQVVNNNCSWGCPCQFNALPTTGQCEATGAWEIKDGYFGKTRLDGLRFGAVAWWPGAIHEGVLDLPANHLQKAFEFGARRVFASGPVSRQ